MLDQQFRVAMCWLVDNVAGVCGLKRITKSGGALVSGIVAVLCACTVSGVTTANGQAGAVGSYIVVDPDSRKILVGYQIDQKRQIASITKVATALVVLDWSRLSGIDLNVEAVVPPSAMTTGGANPLGLRPGDRITLRDGLYASLIGSDNVSAQTLASFIGFDLLRRSGKREDPVAYFVKQMNGLATKLGMEDTRFTNAHGMDSRKPVPYSTSADVARLCVEAMGRSAFRFYVGQATRKVSYRRGLETRAFKVTN
ncbi:MAG: serine hydrolase, partial [Verrucomicrobiales bacterium]|nr:serine hydrolase [Verrucomicrobiales bacterium]